MHDTYMDCPFYEQLQYVQDTRSEILYTYAVSADDRLARQAIDDFASSQRADGLLNACYPNKNANVIPGFSIYITRLSAKDTNGVMKPEVGLPLNLLS